MKRKTKQWLAAKAALQTIAPERYWLFWRCVFGPQVALHKAHIQGVQDTTRKQAVEMADRLITLMGGSLYRRTPRELAEDEDWKSALETFKPLGEPQQGVLLRLIVETAIPPGHPKHQEARVLNRCICILLHDMALQNTANHAGWIVGVGFPAKRAPRKPRKRRPRRG